ncbi:MAG: hypothetical protein MRY57_02475 [Candidatus Pacebacteria bacterium]|nr:hypothetical protein [Candidatus Paceibacterota bacterium]
MDGIISFLFNTAFLWFPIILGAIFWHFWMEWRQGLYRANQKWTLLEISIPKDIHKSPEAMEMVFNTLNDGSGVGNSWKKYFVGAIPHTFSLEIVSIEGSIYFFIRTQKKFKELIKNQIYSQYPKAEVNEVDDYTRYIGDYTQKQDLWELFGVEFELTAHDAYPIKSYVDYGLDKAVGNLEEEQKIDPITATLEYLGSMRKDEQVWMQMIIRSDKWSSWRKDAMGEVNRIMGRDKPRDPDNPATTFKLTHGEQEAMKSIERSLQKQAFEVGFRALYIARPDAFRPANIAGLIGSVRQYGSANLNGFKPGVKTDFDYKYQDISGNRLKNIKNKFFNNYINRAFFQGAELDRAEKEKKPFVLTAEELATMFRFPGRVSETTSLERIEATKAEPPTNLPL